MKSVFSRNRADVAQSVEHQLPKLRVAGSIPVIRSILSWYSPLYLLLSFLFLIRPSLSFVDTFLHPAASRVR